MKFTAIKPHDKKLVLIETDSLSVAEASVGLVSTKVDHGVLWRKEEIGVGLGYVMYEYALFVPTDQQKYASVFGKLIAGNCIVYAFNEIGDTIPVSEDMISEKDIRWLPTLWDVEMAIAHRRVTRPILAVNGEVIWRFPEPREYK
jgi:hypothetical protein